MRRSLWVLALLLAAGGPALAQETPDPAVVAKIEDQAFNHSQVMNIAFYLTDVSGPRLTNSPGYFRAANWVKNTLTDWGLSNATLEPWGDFGSGWELDKSYLALKAPYYQPIMAYPKAWTASTKGLVSGAVVLVDAKDSLALLNYKGKLKGKIVVFPNDDTLAEPFKADAMRYVDTDLAKMQEPLPERRRGNPDSARMAQFRLRGAFARQQAAFLKDEGALMVLSGNTRGKDGTLFVQSWGGNAQNLPAGLTDMVIPIEDLHRIIRLVKAGIPVELEGEVKSHFTDNKGDKQGYDVVGEIPGTDPQLKDQLVMLGGHLDSWHSSTGATDNAAGSAVMLEAVRILKTLDLHPRRTIRIVLWSGEEQGLFGSRGYVKNHFADPTTMDLKPEQPKVSAYYNLDNGSGRVRGVYLQGNEAVRPIFASWLTPFASLDASTLTIRNTGSTDHVSFDAVGIPAFQFIQDPLEYDTRTHHSTADSYDHLSAEDLKQAAAIVATFVYQTAVRDQELPRKPLPEARPAGARPF
ncbi:M20/M25/M40 family metallo-hydrolase [Dinghuibacter silviterrae]|uniref:Carboxypeptidase Q n=1 Tax=Dinghuibacter silviterrae TaxID=1539049 RepID=A0A4R8DXF4_9BACT|nr:M20/M25/M40 family metallo-hydrolase [Dinghuibacter silviterrae]TDX02225.1 peptidase M28-like protein [Dinghuibacter silviterrae]